MSKTILTQELAKNLAAIAVFGAQKSNLDLNTPEGQNLIEFHETFIDEVQKLQELESEELQDEAISAIIDVLETAALFTPTKIDDKIFNIAKQIYGFLDMNRPFKAWIEKIKARRKAKKAAKAARKDEAANN